MFNFVLLVLVFVLAVVVRSKFRNFRARKNGSSLAGPIPLPVIGNLHLLGQYATPFEGFTALSKIYGDIYAIYLGSVPCVVVNNFSLIKEVLIKKGVQFGGRPDYVRYHRLFGGDRNNSLALCDWSTLQKTRRHIARVYCSPKITSTNYQLLVNVSLSEVDYLLKELRSRCVDDQIHVDLKSLVLAACANMFSQYMCSVRFAYTMSSFQKVCRYYDEIFWDINQGYAVDFLPWLSPLYARHMNRLTWWADEIRKFIMEEIVDQHLSTINYEEPPKDFTDALLHNVHTDPLLQWQHIMFELEDFLGGHSAVGNLIMLTLIYLTKYPNVKCKVEEEIHRVTNSERYVSLLDKAEMVYTEATVLETLRFTSSPIVPHVATEDTDLDGHFVAKGTCVILNNYELNRSSQLWTDPLEFQPERFIQDGRVSKPEHFIPFGTGKRTCIGQQLVNGFSFVLLSAIVQHFDFQVTDAKCLCPQAACVALPPDALPMILTPKHPV